MTSKGQRSPAESFPAFRDEMLAAHPGVRAKFDERQRTRDFVAGLRRQLANARRKAGLKQSDLATLLGISQPVVSRIERGDGGDIGLETIYRYAAACGLTPVLHFEPAAGTESGPAWKVSEQIGDVAEQVVHPRHVDAAG